METGRNVSAITKSFAARYLLNAAAAHFPLLDRRAALRQAKKLIRAKRYLVEKGIYAVAGDGFKYVRSMGSVLS